MMPREPSLRVHRGILGRISEVLRSRAKGDIRSGGPRLHYRSMSASIPVEAVLTHPVQARMHAAPP